MKIRIYQINLQRDTEHMCFDSLDRLERFHGSREIDSSIYDKVFDGDVVCEDLEAV